MVKSNPKQAIPELLTLKENYPDIPVLYNYLCMAYEFTGNRAASREIIIENYQKSPDYLFAKINYAQVCLYEGNTEKIPEIFDGKFDLSLIYPERTRYHVSEFTGFAGVMCAYFASITGRVVASPTSLITQNCGVELILIPGGRFMMGSPVGEGRDDEHPAHEVDIRQFYLGRYPVTNEEYARYLEANPNEKQPAYWADRRFNQARQPVVGVDWEEASRFAQWAGGRLPTEAEWEYAVRAGTTSRYFWGKSDTDADEYAWHYAHSQNTTHPVGVKRPNAIGLHDMVGNVWEWQQDRWHDNYHDAPGDGSAWEDGKGSRRVIRGGPWVFEPGYLRSATRGRDDTDSRSSLLGFRLAQDL